MPFGVTDPVVVTDQTNIYVVGGGGPTPRGPGHTQIWDLTAGTWSQGPLLPAPALDNTAGDISFGVIYTNGGFDGANGSNRNQALVLP